MVQLVILLLVIKLVKQLIIHLEEVDIIHLLLKQVMGSKDLVKVAALVLDLVVQVR